MTGRYATLVKAERRQRTLIGLGIYTGLRSHRDGSYSLLYDPQADFEWVAIESAEIPSRRPEMDSDEVSLSDVYDDLPDAA